MRLLKTKTGFRIIGAGKFDEFGDQLRDLDISEEEYLKFAKAKASKEGYDPDKLYLAQDDKHKLVYDGPNGIRKFGSVGYNDFIILTLKKDKTADKKRASYHKRFNKDKIYPKDSPYLLSLKIIW